MTNKPDNMCFTDKACGFKVINNKIMDLIHENMNNLTSLWRTAAIGVDAHVRNDYFEFSAINYSEWPNKLWFKNGVTTQILNKAIDV